MRRFIAAAASVVLVASIAPAVAVVAVGTAAQAATAGTWKQVDTRIWQTQYVYPLKVQPDFDWTASNDNGFYGYTVSGSLGDVTAVYTHGACQHSQCTGQPGSQTVDFTWTQPPPATATEGQAWSATLTSEVTESTWDSKGLSEPRKRMILAFDRYEVEPGGTTGWSWEGSGLLLPDAGTKTGNLVFPTYRSDVTKIRLQLEAEGWAVSYGYEWVPAPTPTPTPTPTATKPGAPKKAAITAVNATTARVTWQAATGSVTGYVVYVSAKMPTATKWSAWKSLKVQPTTRAIRATLPRAGMRVRAYVKAVNGTLMGPASNMAIKQLPAR